MAKTLADLRLACRDYLDEYTAARWSDAELNRYINHGIRQVQSQIQAANECYFLRVEQATAASGSYELAFPADVWGNKLRSLQFYQSTASPTGQAWRVEPGSLEDIYHNMNIVGIPFKYTLHGGYLRWYPQLSTAGMFRFVYAMKENEFQTDGSDDTNSLGQIADEHQDCISLYAAILAREKVGADTKNLYAFYNQRMLQITNDVQPIDPATTPQFRIDP